MRHVSGRAVKEWIAERAEREGVQLSGTASAELGIYVGLLTKWNKTVNLTALPLDPLSDEAMDRLLIEPLIAAREARPSDELLIDVGSGGGSPAVPLKVAAPWLRLMMVESRGRKSAFLREVVRELRWPDASVETTRLEELAHRSADAKADLISLRAVRADADLWAVVGRLLRPEGRVLWFGARGDDYQQAVGFSLADTRTLGATGTTLSVLTKR